MLPVLNSLKAYHGKKMYHVKPKKVYHVEKKNIKKPTKKIKCHNILFMSQERVSFTNPWLL